MVYSYRIIVSICDLIHSCTHITSHYFQHVFAQDIGELGVFGVIVEAVFIQSNVTTSLGMIQHSEEENAQTL